MSSLSSLPQRNGHRDHSNNSRSRRSVHPRALARMLHPVRNEPLFSPSTSISMEEEKKSDEVTISRALLRESGLRLNQSQMSLWSGGVTSVSSAATALNANVNLTFDSSNFPELTSLGAIYDEARVTSIKVHYAFYATGSVAVYGGVAGVVAVGFDPQLATASFNNVVEQQYNTGPRWIGAYSPGSAINTSLQAGVLPCLTVPTPSPLSLLTSTECPGNGWFAIESAAQPIIGKLHAYAYPGPALCVVNLLYFVEVACHFRMRV